MHLICVGRKFFNLAYFIAAEEVEGASSPGLLRVTFESGTVFDLTGDEAERFRRQIAGFLHPRERKPSVGKPSDPRKSK